MNKFNIRVYGILVQDGCVLLSEETVRGKRITKFPGGGLEWGEGLKEALQREWQEELQTEIAVKDHFYTTDFFVESFLGDHSQIISIYYFVETVDAVDLQKLEDLEGEREEKHFWAELKNISRRDLSLIIDQHVAEMLREKFTCKLL